MPALRRYTVEQVREVQVSATSPTEAADLANRVFSGTKKPEDQINVRGDIRETSVTIREEHY